MSNFDRNIREPGDPTIVPRSGFSSRSMAGAAIVVVLILVAVGYVFVDRSNTGPAATHQPAAATTAPVAPPPATPESPATAPKP